MTEARGDRPSGGSWADRTGRDLLEAVAAHRSPLGGGSVAAITAALAAALAERCAAAMPDAGEDRARAAALREQLLAIADDDAAVLGSLIGGHGVASSASDPPRRLRDVAAEVAEIARRLERDGGAEAVSHRAGLPHQGGGEQVLADGEQIGHLVPEVPDGEAPRRMPRDPARSAHAAIVEAHRRMPRARQRPGQLGDHR